MASEPEFFANVGEEPIVIEGPDPSWARRFEDLRSQLEVALGPRALRIDHVGSTAIEGLPAKPIIDIQLVVVDPDDESYYRPAVERLGLVLRVREPGHRMFRPGPGRPRDVHLHVYAPDSEWVRNHLLFVAYMRAHPDDAAAYAAVKTNLASLHRGDRQAYSDAKSDFVTRTLARAERWAARTGWRP